MGFKRKRAITVFGITIFSGLLIFILALVFVYFKTENYINKNLTQLIAEKSGGLYTFKFDDFSMNFKNLSLTFTQVSLEFDEEKSIEILNNSPEKIFFRFNSDEVNARNIQLFSLIRKKHLFFDELLVKTPEIEVVGINGIERNSSETFSRFFKELRPLFKKYIKKITINQIDFTNANYKIFGNIGDSLQVSNANQISLIVKKLSTDSAAVFNESNFFNSENVLIQMNRLKYNLSDSLHEISIDTLEYSLFAADIFARGFRLQHKKKNTTRNLYTVYVPEFYMKSKNVTRFEINDTLRIQYLDFRQPQIQFYQKIREKQISIEEISNFNLYRLIENQFRLILVDTFILENARLTIFNQPNETDYQQRFENLNVVLNGFELDSASSKNTSKLLHSNDLEMNVANYHLVLEDNLHDFRADFMHFSTSKNVLEIKNLSVNPANPDNEESRTIAKVQCDGINIRDVNLTTLYHTRRLPTTKIEIKKPKVNIEYHHEILRNKNQGESGLLFELVSAYLRGVYAEVVFIHNGELNISNLQNKREIGYFETGFNFNLSEFSLDSTSIKQTDRFFYASHFDLAFSDYQMKLIDDLHKLSVDSISVKSFDRRAEIVNLHLQPIFNDADEETMKKFNRSELYNVFLPKITMWGVDLRRAFFYKQLNIHTFQISNPKIYFENFGTVRKNRDAREFSELYDLIFNYLSDFNIRNIIIPNGNFNWINHTKNEKTTTFDNDFSATLENFRLNKNELNKKRLLFSDNFDLSVKDQTFLLSDSVHILRAGEIYLSTKNSKISINSGLLYPVITTPKFKNLNTTFQVSIPSLDITDFDFRDAFYSRKINLRSLDINNPQFKVYTKSEGGKTLDLQKYTLPFPAFMNALYFRQFRINNGEFITYKTTGIHANAQSSFKADLIIPNIAVTKNPENKANITSDNMLGQISNFITPLENSHTLKIKTLKFNRSKKNLLIEGFEVNPLSKNSLDNNFLLRAPLIKLDGFNYYDALKNNDLKFTTVEIDDPQISIEVNDSVNGGKIEQAKSLDLFPFIEPYVNSLQVNKLRLLNTDLKVNWLKKQLINKKINFTFNEVDISENNPANNLLNSKEFEISVTDLHQKSKNNLYDFRVDSLIYNSKKHNIRLKNISVNPLLNLEDFSGLNGFQTDVVWSETRFIEINEVNENMWLKHNRLEAGHLKIGPTQTHIFRNKRYPFNHAQRPPWPQDLIKNIKQNFVFTSFSLLPSEIIYSELGEISDERSYLKFKMLEASGSKITNIQAEIEKNPLLSVKASSVLFNGVLLNANFRFDMASKNYVHEIEGSLGKMDLTQINPILEKSAPVKIVSGNLNRFDFSLKCNSKTAFGELYFGYDNLEIALLEFQANKAKVSKFASFWANKMVLNSKNPKKEDEFFPASINFQRDVERSILHFWWKTILTGARQTVGIENEDQKK